MIKTILLFLAMFLVAASTATPADPKIELQKAKAAHEVLDAWHQHQPVPAKRVLHIVCWTPADRELPDNYQVRLTRIMKHIQNFYLREMERFGFEGRTIGLPFDDRDQLVLHTVRGQHGTNHYTKSSGNEIRKECLPTLKKAGIDAERETIMIMCNLATWDQQKLRFKHESPYYAGGSFRSGTAWQLDSPELDSKNLVLKTPMIFDGEYGRISLGKHNSIFIGGIAHELGHALGLPHCRARPDEAVRGTALMGSGNRTYGDELRGEGRGSFLTLAHALRLASHPQFSGSVKGLQQQARAFIDDLTITSERKAIHIEGVVKGSPPIYAVVAYFDPDGGGDYDSTTATAIPAGDGRFEIYSDALRAGKKGQLRLFPLHANGSAAGQMSRTPFRYSYLVAKDGTPDVTTIQTRLTLKPFLDSLVNGDRKTASEFAEKLKPGKASAIANTLLNPPRATASPAGYDRSAKSVSLTILKPRLARVGWARPMVNRVPNQSVLLESAGEIFENGIFAHAPSRYEYELGKTWEKITGKVGIASGNRGSVQFEIVGDGKSLWKSKVIREGTLVEFDVPVSGVNELDLLANPTSDGSRADWGLWLEPMLKRQ